MGKPSHLALHPFNRVPILQHGDFAVYKTSAIVTYLDETFPSQRVFSHERNVFPGLGIPSDEKVVAHALPKIEVGLTVAERALAHGNSPEHLFI